MKYLPITNCILSVLLLFSMGFQTFYKSSVGVYEWLNVFDTFVCVFFLGGFIQKYSLPENKSKFMKWGWWVDLLTCIPVSNGAWIQYHNVLRLVRSVKCLKVIHDYFHEDKNSSKFVDCCVIGVAFICFAAIAVFNCEKNVDGANIKNLSDSLWWALATVTTIGYGDRFPVTDIGRFIAGFVMIGGVGLYASFTAFIVMRFQPSDDRIDKLVEENKLLHNKLNTILQKIS